ncbi:DNA sulfur modification protein DndB [Alteromonas macleodii]|uniref:DGQHR domain protein n=1 Tax=Alteromonas macleodii TaxID=28108 RepID=A0AB36FLJ1_ALTMA|nr:DNA sulfur modification protein DndB [Alteromonas macleodii]OES24692.1 DGQHR domain protein [Alteromonas macleodii]OES25795.1 DGQHR domain protein [Alteromonas macleodii]OES25876.1 DGQHR domain protein [Alteromonas macleodii]OES38976.1 DGQHR domain protein [Alteromonas macleodii]
MATRYIRVNSDDHVLSAHIKYGTAVSEYKFGTTVIDLEEVDISEVTDQKTFKKGQDIPGIWAFLEKRRIDNLLVLAAAAYLNNEIIESDSKSTDAITGRSFTRADLMNLLEEAKLLFDDWLAQYTERAQAYTKAKQQEALDEAEKHALAKTNIEQSNAHLSGICFNLPAIAGKMGNDIYFAVMVPFRQLAQMFLFNEDELPVELRTQRHRNPKRVEAIGQYIATRHDDFVIPALTASVSEKMTFEPLGGSPNIGNVKIPMDAKMIINDGQHLYPH